MTVFNEKKSYCDLNCRTMISNKEWNFFQRKEIKREFNRIQERKNKDESSNDFLVIMAIIIVQTKKNGWTKRKKWMKERIFFSSPEFDDSIWLHLVEQNKCNVFSFNIYQVISLCFIILKKCNVLSSSLFVIILLDLLLYMCFQSSNYSIFDNNVIILVVVLD